MMDLQKSEKKYWASIEELEKDPQVIEQAGREFTSTPLQDSVDGFSRRDFMKLMAASSALASTACFQRPVHNILPYVNQPEEVTFGVANFYASTCGECASSCGVLVKTREGRPIKLEGNPDHPMSKGGLCSRGQASILNLYDPDRLRTPVTVTRGSGLSEKTTWGEVDKTLGNKLKAIKAGKGRVRILTETITSPSTKKLIADFLTGFAHGAHVVYDPISAEPVAEAQEKSYGMRVLPRYRFDLAETIVSIDADFLGTWLSPIEFTKQFTKNRKLGKNKKELSKLVTFESMMTLTGTNADERFGIRPEDGAKIALALAHELRKLGVSVDSETAGLLNDFSAEKVSEASGVPAEVIVGLAKELARSKGRSLVIAGSVQGQSENGLSLQVATNLLNTMLQNDGVTVDYSVSPSMQAQGSSRDLVRLISDMRAGEVDALFIYGANPSYYLPKELGFDEATAKVGLVVSFNDRVDETAKLADFILPDSHALESWNDSEPQKNLFSLMQPTIRPLFDTRSFQDSLLELNRIAGLGNAKLVGVADWHEYLQNNWKNTVYKEYGLSVPFASFWETALRDGVFDGVAKRGQRNATARPRAFRSASLKKNLPANKSNDGFSLTLHAQPALYDGKNANNSWLQELPDPVTRICWDNYASISPKVASNMGVKNGDVVRIKVNDKSIELPAQVQPGLHDRVVAVALGYGRKSAGRVGTSVGQNMFEFATYKSAPVYSGMNAAVTKTGAKYLLASIQDHHTTEGRPIVKEAGLKEWRTNPSAGNEEKEELTTVWPKYDYPGYRWGMTIDLNSCTGCNACVVGCQAENNIPVVGKEMVFRGRIMHWIRIDRYYTGTPDSPSVVHQPMLCQHCENAPCETVCPVVATTHDDEGLNQQIYNRCVGTRYCANNCPYKVRRFNWFDYNYGGQHPYPLPLAQNPEVTVRSRGVMEKCTFCIQRIHDAKNKAKDLGRSVQDGEIKTACQQSCPGDAISFGNINDLTSEVTVNSSDPRGFHVLEDLNTRPSVTYLTKIRNSENV